jgi:hypothetical protein
MIMPGPAGMQPGSKHGIVMDVTVAAGMLPINTVGAPGGMIASGNPGCGSGVGAGAGGWMGAWQCGMVCSTMSPTRAAGGLNAGLAAGAQLRDLASSVTPWTSRQVRREIIGPGVPACPAP